MPVKSLLIKGLIIFAPILPIVSFSLTSFFNLIVFAVPLGSLLGLLSGRLIYKQYGEQNTLIFGIILILIFGYNLFLSETTALLIPIAFLFGAGHGLCGIVHMHGKIVNHSFNIKHQIYYIFGYQVYSLMLISTIIKLNNIGIDFYITVLLISVMIILAAFIENFYSGNISIFNNNNILLISSWIVFLSNDIYVLLLGLLFLVLSFGKFSKYRNIMLNNYSLINIQIILGLLLVFPISFYLKNNNDFVYFAILGSLFLQLLLPLLKLRSKRI